MSEEAKWYVVHTYSGYENKVASNLEKAIENKSLGDMIQEVKIPTEIVTEIKDGKEKSIERKIFPGYVLVRMEMDDRSWAAVRNTPGVTGFVGNINRTKRPMPITKDEAMNLLQKSGVIKGDKQVHVRQSFDVGDVVKISEGPFASLYGTIKEIDLEREKLRVEVQIFGRSTPVEVNFLQVEKV